MTPRLRTILAVGPLNGAVDRFEALLEEHAGVDAVVVAGDLAAPWQRDAYPAIFRALGRTGRPTFWVPGPNDAPLRDFLPEATNLEVTFPDLHCVHGTFAFGPGASVFAGMGGTIDDEPDAVVDEEALLRYPGWQAAFRLKALREVDEHERVLLFATLPQHKGLGSPGSAVVAELIKTFDPRVAIVGADEVVEERLGRTLVVSPGRFEDGRHALVDVRERFATVATPVAAGGSSLTDAKEEPR